MHTGQCDNLNRIVFLFHLLIFRTIINFLSCFGFTCVRWTVLLLKHIDQDILIFNDLVLLTLGLLQVAYSFT